MRTPQLTAWFGPIIMAVAVSPTFDGHPVSMWMQLEYNFGDPEASSEKRKQKQ